MANNIIFSSIVTVASAALCFGGCSSSSKISKTASTDPSTGTVTVPYTIAHNYFVKNDVETVPEMINDKVQFDTYFGTATTMGRDGKPTAIDFEKQYVIVATLPQTALATTITPVGLTRDQEGFVKLTCNVKRGAMQTYTVRPLELLLVDKKYSGYVTVDFEPSAEIVMVYFDKSGGSEEIVGTVKELGGNVVYDYNNINAIAVSLPVGMDLTEGMNLLAGLKGVVSVAPDRKMQLD